MKAVLKFSLFFNLGLAGCLVCILIFQRRAEKMSVSHVVLEGVNPTAQVVTPVPSSPEDLKPMPFQWSQIESPDYRTYVRNLRNAGCPAATLQAIVMADVDARYQERYDELGRKLTSLEDAPWTLQIASVNEQEAIKKELAGLPQQEEDEIDDLLGLKPVESSALIAGQTSVTSQHDGQSAIERPAVMPFVFRRVDISTLKLNKQQLQVVNDLRQNFLDQIGGSNQNPNDPAYLKRWQEAQPLADNMLRGMLGDKAYEAYFVAVQTSGQAPSVKIP
jgi:hypothetical protein